MANCGNAGDKQRAAPAEVALTPFLAGWRRIAAWNLSAVGKLLYRGLPSCPLERSRRRWRLPDAASKKAPLLGRRRGFSFLYIYISGRLVGTNRSLEVREVVRIAALPFLTIELAGLGPASLLRGS